MVDSSDGVGGPARECGALRSFEGVVTFDRESFGEGSCGECLGCRDKLVNSGNSRW